MKGGRYRQLTELSTKSSDFPVFHYQGNQSVNILPSDATHGHAGHIRWQSFSVLAVFMTVVLFRHCLVLHKVKVLPRPLENLIWLLMCLLKPCYCWLVVDVWFSHVTAKNQVQKVIVWLGQHFAGPRLSAWK